MCPQRVIRQRKVPSAEKHPYCSLVGVGFEVVEKGHRASITQNSEIAVFAQALLFLQMLNDEVSPVSSAVGEAEADTDAVRACAGLQRVQTVFGRVHVGVVQTDPGEVLQIDQEQADEHWGEELEKE